MSKHPIQPLIQDPQGVVRFKENAIVRYLLDNGGHDMNRLAAMPFSDEDREQFAQLIGYSLGGFADLSYVSDTTYEAAKSQQQTATATADARIEALEARLREAQNSMRDGVARLYGISPEDLRCMHKDGL